ncbi:MAG: hypothetical protein KAH32_05145 [Chlamydiia bacterium]|nr:hypothetical protein [Chlamydiia bacterium]
MGNFYDISKSVRITNSDPIDGDRYLAQDLTARTNLLDDTGSSGVVRAHVGVQVYVADTSGDVGNGIPADPDTNGAAALYILKALPTSADLQTAIWDKIPIIPEGGSLGVSNFIELLDTPGAWPVDATDYILSTDNTASGDQKLFFESKKSAFNKDYGEAGDMAAGIDGRTSSAGNNDNLTARIDHDHAGIYYDVNEIDIKLSAIEAGIKYIWPTKDDIDGNPAAPADGEQGLLKVNSGTTTATLCSGSAWLDMTVYKWTAATTCWTEFYTMGGANTTTAELVKLHADTDSDPVNDPKDILVTGDIGGYTAGETVKITGDVYTVLKTLLSKGVQPTLASAAAYTVTNTISPLNSALVLVGTPINNPSELTASLTSKGTINNHHGDGAAYTMDQVGNANANSYVTVGGLSATVGGTVTGTIAYGTNKVTMQMSTQNGPDVLRDSNGKSATVSIPREIHPVSSHTITGGYYIAWGKVDSSALPTNDTNTWHNRVVNHGGHDSAIMIPGNGNTIYAILQGTWALTDVGVGNKINIITSSFDSPLTGAGATIQTLTSGGATYTMFYRTHGSYGGVDTPATFKIN